MPKKASLKNKADETASTTKPAAKTAPADADTSKVAPTRAEIAKRAYEIYAGRGSGGRELEDWLQAERELSAKISGR